MGARRKTKKRSTTRGRKKLPNWTLLILGLAIGILLTWVIQYTIKKSDNPQSGISKLIRKTLQKHNAQTKAVKKVVNKKIQKTKFQFYEILTKNESLLPAHYREDKTVVTKVRYALQVAALAKYEDADRLKARLALSGFVAHIQKVSILKKGTFHRVRLGPYSSLAELDHSNQKLQKMGFQAQRIKIDIKP